MGGAFEVSFAAAHRHRHPLSRIRRRRLERLRHPPAIASHRNAGAHLHYMEPRPSRLFRHFDHPTLLVTTT